MRMGWILVMWMGLCGFSDPGMDLLREEAALTDSELVLYQKVSDQLRCPTCTGISVRQSDSLFSQQIRTAVIEQIREHHAESEIMQFFIDRYGQWILREPPKQGLHWVAWVLPLVFALFGAIWVGAFLSRSQKRAS